MRLLSTALTPLASRLLTFDGCNFSHPVGEPAIVPADSVSWRVFSNPVSLYVGGIAAVLLELGEPRVRAGIWDNSDFRRNPGERMRRTGAAAMVTVFAARSEFEALAAQVNAVHAQIAGETPEGQRYRADDPDLLLWVQATASFAFLSAYTRFVRPLTISEKNGYYAEAAAGARLYGVTDPPRSDAELQRLFDDVAPRLTPSPVIHQFLHIVRAEPILPAPLRPLQRLIVRAALGIIPERFRESLAIGSEPRATAAERALVRLLARTAGALHVPTSPWALAAQRLGLPADYLQRRAGPGAAEQPAR
ncbi:oxygenase MpaB family protein [Sphingomonas sp.]|uniref:oxygenase MpaB family protein n=1 Tax=Sphingomonas sp. TaxID=28214 RepID=UPI001814A2B6|nr:oxygenase MpaB family protein [Sphingomonas sp.]MBA3512473.1 DUF2236 domain-containing protein [Sphingomonas sp.]